MDKLKHIAEKVELFLDSYKDDSDVWRRLFGPQVYLTKPPFWAFRERRLEHDAQRRLKAFGLPPIDQEFRVRWYQQMGQMMEDAGGYIRRKWVCSYGFTLEEYEQFLTRKGEQND